jgi:hypothetical protein
VRDFGDLNKLVKFARDNAVSVSINYSEAGDEMEIEVISASKDECYIEKRIIDVDWFIDKWKHITELRRSYE